MRLVARLDDVAVMGQTIEQCRGHLRVGEDGRPLGEVQVGDDHHAGVFVQPAEQMKQQRPAGLAEGRVAEFVDFC